MTESGRPVPRRRKGAGSPPGGVGARPFGDCATLLGPGLTPHAPDRITAAVAIGAVAKIPAVPDEDPRVEATNVGNGRGPINVKHVWYVDCTDWVPNASSCASVF